MTFTQLKELAKTSGWSFYAHMAQSGSYYITINGVKYRLSDHYQPSYYQVRDYIDCWSFEDIHKRVLAQIVESSKVNTTDEWIYVDEEGGYFEKNPNYIPS